MSAPGAPAVHSHGASSVDLLLVSPWEVTCKLPHVLTYWAVFRPVGPQLRALFEASPRAASERNQAE